MRGAAPTPIIACADSGEPPLRLILGSSAQANIERTLTERLAAVRGQAASAAGADGPAAVQEG